MQSVISFPPPRVPLVAFDDALCARGFAILGAADVATMAGVSPAALQALEPSWDALCQDEEIVQVLVATHVPPFEENLVRKPGDLAWSIRNAYSGNLTLGRRIVQCPKVTHVISGHTHAGGRWRIQTPHGTVESYVVGSDYGRPACTVIDLPWISPV